MLIEWFDMNNKIQSNHQNNLNQLKDFLSGVGKSDPLNALDLFVSMGLTPPQSILIEISKRHTEYCNAKGSKSLEEVFYGKPTRKKGNYANKKHLDSRNFKRMAYIECMAIRDPSTSKIDHAADYIKNHHCEKISEESLVRTANKTLNLILAKHTNSKEALIKVLNDNFDMFGFVMSDDQPASPDSSPYEVTMLDMPSPEEEKELLDLYLTYLTETDQEIPDF